MPITFQEITNPPSTLCAHCSDSLCCPNRITLKHDNHLIHKDCLYRYVISRGEALCLCGAPFELSSVFSWKERVVIQLKNCNMSWRQSTRWRPGIVIGITMGLAWSIYIAAKIDRTLAPGRKDETGKQNEEGVHGLFVALDVLFSLAMLAISGCTWDFRHQVSNDKVTAAALTALGAVYGACYGGFLFIGHL